MKKLFRGNDRRMLTKMQKVMMAIVRRDSKATDNTTLTTALSTRDEIIPAADLTLGTNWQGVLDHINAQLLVNAPS